MELEVLALHNSTNSSAAEKPGNAVLLSNESTGDYVDRVAMYSKTYAELFKDKYEKTGYSRSTRRMAIVKISAPGKNTIWRIASTKGVTGIGASKIGLPFSAIWEMGETKTPFNVTVEKGCRLPYYWHHPVAANRISTKLGLISIGLAVLSIIISIILCRFH